MSLLCPSCNAENKDDFAFCPYCGTDLRMFFCCQNCGQEVGPTAKFCSECGTLLRKTLAAKSSAKCQKAAKIPTVEVESLWPEEWPMLGKNLSRSNWDGVSVHIQAPELSLAWKFQTDTDLEISAPVVACGKVLVSSYDRHIYAIDAATGKLQWVCDVDVVITLGGPVQHIVPLIAYGRAFLCSGGKRKVYAFDLETGSLQWVSKLGDCLGLAVAEGKLLVASVAPVSGIYNLDLETGKEQELVVEGQHWPPMIVGNEMVVIDRECIKMFDLRTRKVKWVRDYETYERFATPPVANGMVFVTSRDLSWDEELLALDNNNGSKTLEL